MAAAVDYYRPRTSKLNTDDLPDHSALEQLFARQLSANNKLKQSRKQDASSRVQLPVRQRRLQDTDSESSVDLQMQQLDHHRQTVQQLSDKVIDLHSKMSELEKQNAELRRQLDSQLYDTKLNFTGDDHVSLEPTELARRYAIVKSKLQRQSVQLKEYKQKVVELQKKLIERNEQEKEYLKLQESHESQTAMLQQLRSKTDRANSLQDVYHKQEQVVKKLQQLVNSKHKDENFDQRANFILREENRLLRTQLDSISATTPRNLTTPDDRTVNNVDNKRHTAPNTNRLSNNSSMPSAVRFQQTQRVSSRNEQTKDSELIALQHKHELAQQRIHSLEQQLEENARHWSREKTDYRLRLQEAECGLQRSTPSPLPLRRLAPISLSTRDMDSSPSYSQDHKRPTKQRPTVAINWQ